MRRRGGCWSWCGRSLVCFFYFVLPVLVADAYSQICSSSAPARRLPPLRPRCASTSMASVFASRSRIHAMRRPSSTCLPRSAVSARSPLRWCLWGSKRLVDGHDRPLRHVTLSTVCSSIVYYNDQCLFLYILHPEGESARAGLRPTGRHLLRLRVSASSQSRIQRFLVDKRKVGSSVALG
jgi:hypothetical protein